jgi:hypothetical protein
MRFSRCSWDSSSVPSIFPSPSGLLFVRAHSRGVLSAIENCAIENCGIMQVHKAKEYWRTAKAASVSVVEGRGLYNLGLSPTRIPRNAGQLELTEASLVRAQLHQWCPFRRRITTRSPPGAYWRALTRQVCIRKRGFWGAVFGTLSTRAQPARLAALTF